MKKYLFYISLFLSMISTSDIWAQEIVLKDCFLQHKNRFTSRIYEDRYGFIWFLRTDGFYRFDGKEVSFINPTIDQRAIHHSAGFIFDQKNGDYWFAARDAGLIVYRAEQNTFLRKTEFESGDTSYTIYTRYICENPYDPDTKFVSGDQGLWQVDDELNVVKHIAHTDSVSSNYYGRFNPRQIRKIVYDHKRNYLWIASISGLYSYDLANEKISIYPMDLIRRQIADPKKTYDYLLINDIILEGDQLLLATWGGGIMTFDITTKTYSNIYFKDEQSLKKKTGNTQIAKTSDSLYFVAHERREVASWTSNSSYLSSPLVNDQKMRTGIGASIDRLGYLWIGHWTDICRYTIQGTPPKAQTAQIYIPAIFHKNKLVQQKMNRWDGQHLDLVEIPDTLSFQFRAINPLSYDSIFYEYKLDGVDEQWQSNGISEQAVYTNLKEREYQFQARYYDAISKKYIYTGKVSLRIEKNELVSRNILWLLLGLLALIILAFFYYRYYSKRQQEKAILAYERQLREVQDAALRAQMNPHFLFNSLNSIRYFIVTNDNEKAAGYLTKFSRLIRMILENSKKKTVALSEEIRLLGLYVNMEQIRFEDKFDYEVIIADNINPATVLIPPLLIQPYIENAILHGINPKEDQGKILLSFQKEGNQLIIRIVDDGIGRKKSKALKQSSIFKKHSLGLSITQTRLQLSDIGAQRSKLDIIDLYDENENALGTEVRIQLYTASSS